MKKRKSRRLQQSGINPTRFERGQVKFYLYLIPIAVIMALPILMIVLNAFKPLDELNAYPPRFFVRMPTWENFRRLFSATQGSSVPISRYLFNSIVVTLIVVVCTVVICVAAGYVLSKKRFKYKKFLFSLNTLALMFVPVAVAIPRYLVIVFTGMYDSFWAQIIPLLAMPVGLFLLKQFIDQIPDALIEAAVIDGADDFTILRRIIIPIIMPAVATVAMMAFQAAWNSTEASAMFVENETLKTFAYYMSTLTGATGNTISGQGISAAASLILFLPNLILFIILQSRVMNTMAHSGLK